MKPNKLTKILRSKPTWNKLKHYLGRVHQIEKENIVCVIWEVLNETTGELGPELMATPNIQEFGVSFHRKIKSIGAPIELWTWQDECGKERLHIENHR